jgi:hypothetical protein
MPVHAQRLQQRCSQLFLLGKPGIKLQNRNRAAGLGLPRHAEAGEKELGA